MSSSGYQSSLAVRRKAWFLVTCVCYEMNNENLEKLRHAIGVCQAVKTKVKLTSSILSWGKKGYGRGVKRTQVPLNFVQSIEQDEVFLNVLLCCFRCENNYVQIVTFKFQNLVDVRALVCAFRSWTLQIDRSPSIINKTLTKKPMHRSMHSLVMLDEPATRASTEPDRIVAGDRSMQRRYGSTSAVDDLTAASARVFHCSTDSRVVQRSGTFQEAVNGSVGASGVLSIGTNTAVNASNGIEFTLTRGVGGQLQVTLNSSSNVESDADVNDEDSNGGLSIDGISFEDEPVDYPEPGASLVLNKMSFSTFCGNDVIVSGQMASRRETVSGARRSNNSQLKCYVFSQQPLKCGEELSVSVINVDPNSSQGLVFGMTSCDPSLMCSMDLLLPVDPDELMDRPEYWVVIKNILSGTSNCDEGDVLTFSMTNEGEVLFNKNQVLLQRLMHVDKTLAMWPFLDINGRATAIKLNGMNARTLVERPETEAAPSSAPMVTPFSSSNPSTTSSPSIGSDGMPCIIAPAISPRPSQGNQDGGNCCLCLDRRCDCVIYRCGHVCMCYECGLKLRESHVRPLCPICRQPIADLIKMFNA